MSAARALTSALLCAASAFAQDRPNGFYFVSPLGFSSGYNDNFLVGNRRTSDTVSILTGPTGAFMKSTHRMKTSIRYQPEFEFFARHSDLNAMNHSGVFRLQYQVSPRVSIETGDYFFSTQDPSRGLGNSLLLLPRGRYYQNSAYGGVDYRWSAATRLGFRLDSAVTTATLPAPVTGRLNQISNAATVTLERSVGLSHNFIATYSFLRASPMRPEIAGRPVNVNLGSLTYAYQFAPSLTARLSGGYVRAGQSGFLGGAALEKRVNGLLLAVGVQRFVAFFGGVLQGRPVGGGTVPFADGLTSSATYQVVSFRAVGQITRRLGTETVIQHGLNGIDRENRDIRSTMGQARLDYRFTDRLIGFVRTDYYNQDVTDFWPLPGRQLRAMGGIEIVLSRSPEPAVVGAPRRSVAEEPARRPAEETVIPPPTRVEPLTTNQEDQ